ncbi:MAG: DUF3592 domain-containing protein [Acidobacteriota bacterium]
MVGTVFMGLGGWLLTAGVLALDGALRSRRWPATEGVVLVSDLHRESDEGTSYRAEIAYQYRVDEHEFIGNRPRFANWMKSSLSAPALRLLREFRKGSNVTVFYDPHDPAKSVLVRGVNGAVILAVTFGVIVVAFGAYALHAA